MSEPLRIVHVISGLRVGGAERVLQQLVQRLPAGRFAQQVIGLGPMGPIGEELRAAGVPVRALGLRPRLPNPWLLLRLARWLRAARPDVVQTWLYHADLLGGVAARLAGAPPVLWGIHHGAPLPSLVRFGTRQAARACAALSHVLPRRIVCCARSALAAHVRLGYAERGMRLIPNGYDLAALRPDAGARAALAAELSLPPDALWLGHVARYEAVKDHANFVRAALRLMDARPAVHAVLCGAGVGWENAALSAVIERHRERFHLLGRRPDPARINAAVDVAVLSSLSEAFPNVVAEAMACGTPCAVTDVGDAAEIVGETGRVVPPGDAAALATAIGALIDLGPAGRAALGAAARARIEARYSLERMLAAYGALYEEVHAEARAQRVSHVRH